MSFKDAAAKLSPEIYVAFKQALELGRWPDGRALSRDQKEICMDAIITYETENNVPEEQRVGYLKRDKPTPCSQKTASAEKGSGTGQDAPDIWVPSGETRH